ncbi:MAG: ATP-binding protein [Youngiibacter sp.]|nr:ATP-binding protein [Youngiibacter sp.]
MIHEETRRKLRALNLDELVEYLDMHITDSDKIELTFDEKFQLMIEYLYQVKYNTKTERLLKLSKLRLPRAEMNDILYAQRGIDKHKLLELGTCEFMHERLNIVFQGFTGSGKTFLACAIGKQACKQQYQTRYIRVPDLLMEYDESTLMPKGIQKLLKKYTAYHLLILDEWLLEEISDDEQHFLFELIERRYGVASNIFCTQFRNDEWHKRLGGGVHADAIMDRIVHNSVYIETGSLNMREFYSSRK